jgi:hypothetical protein
MATPNWLTIALAMSSVIATLIAPLLPGFVESRKNQPKPTPEAAQPKNRIQRMGAWLRRRPWVLPAFGIVLNVCILLPYALRHASPITAYIVLEISIIVASTFLNLAFMSISSIIELMREMLDLDSRLHEVISGIIDVEGITIDRLGQLEKGLKTKKLPKTRNLG